MIGEIMHDLIKDRINKMDYTCANVYLALLKVQQMWKIHYCRIILDMESLKNQGEIINEERFVLLHLSLGRSSFSKFMDYLASVHMNKVKFDEKSQVVMQSDVLYKLGNYDLCFVGHFPISDFQFYGRSSARMSHGIDKPLYYANYVLHDSILAQEHPKIDLTHLEIPFNDVEEAINYYWQTRLEAYASWRFGIYLPLYDASIRRCEINDSEIIVTLDNSSRKISQNKLALACIGYLNNKPELSKRYELIDDKISINLGFKPERISLTLLRGKEKLDEYNHYSPRQPTLDLEKFARVPLSPTGDGNITYDFSTMHPRVREECESLFMTGHYAEAIFEACKVIAIMVKEKTNLDLPEKALMSKVFKLDDPIIVLNELRTQSERDEQEGFMLLYMGAMQGIRNPKGHDLTKQNDPIRTFEYLAFASLLARRIDEGKVTYNNEKIERIEGVHAHLFFPIGTPNENKTLQYHKTNLHHKLMINLKTNPYKAYYMPTDSFGWKLIEKFSDLWVSENDLAPEDDNFTKQWCEEKGYELIPRTATKSDLLERA